MLEEARLRPAVDAVGRRHLPGRLCDHDQVGGLSQRWEGEARPGHFDGVATVVAKLLLSARPDVALFGEKDFQQLAVIRRMAADLAIPVEIAASRRCARRTASRCRRVTSISPTTIAGARSRCRGRSTMRARPSSTALRSPLALDSRAQSLVDAGFSRIDYFALVDAATLEPLDAPAGAMRLIAAAVIGGTRLIDNSQFESMVQPR